MPEFDLSQYLEIGIVGKAHGIRGEFKVVLYGDEPENFHHYPEILLQAKSDTVQQLSVDKVRVQGRAVVLASKQVTDRTQAEALNGQRVWIAEQYLTVLDDDEFYWHDVIGAKVITSTGDEVGRLAKLFTTAAGEILVVVNGSEEVMIPARPEFLVEVGADEIIVDLPLGLLELNKKK